MMVSHLGGAARKTFIILAGFDWCLLKIRRHCCRPHCSHKYKTFCFFFKIILLYDFYLNYIVYTIFGIMDTSIITHTFMLSCASNVIIQKNRRWRSFFDDSKFVATPSPSWSLHIYAETADFGLAAQSSPSYASKLNVMIVRFWISYI